MTMGRRRRPLLLLLGATAAALELRVTTAVGSRFLDKKVDVTVEDDALIGALKDLLAVRFPGAPPRSLQRLFFGSRPLRDEEPAASLREDEDDDEEAPTRIPVTLDVVPPVTLGRPRPPDDVEDRVRAYAAESAALDHARRMLADEFDEDEEADELLGVCARVANDVRRHERALLATLGPELETRRAKVTAGIVRDGRGLLAKRDPRKAFFESGFSVKKEASLAARLSVILDMDYREGAKVAAGLLVAANVGVKDAGRKAFLLLMLPMALALKTRPARYLQKVAWYLLPRGPQHADGFFQVMLNGPQQLIMALDEEWYLYELYRPLVADAALLAAGDDGSARGLASARDDDGGWTAGADPSEEDEDEDEDD